MPTTYNDPIMLDSTGQDIVDKLDSIASLMGDGVIDDTSTTATDKTWSASKENTVVNGLQSNVIANTKLIKDTVGWSGKNKFKVTIASGTARQGVTYTVDKDKKITTSGTTTADDRQDIGQAYLEAGTYKVIGNPANSGVRLRIFNSNDTHIFWNESGEVTTIVIPTSEVYTVGIRYGSGVNMAGLTFAVMIFDADILDPTYEPYFGSTAFPRSEQAVLGAVNVLVNKAVSQTKNNITYTVNANKSISLSGTASALNNITLNTMTGAELKALGSKLYLSGGCNSSVYLQLRTDTWQSVASSAGNEVEFSTASFVDGDTYTLSVIVMNNTDTTGLVLYPQISTAPNQPYSFAMTNKELTEKVQGIINAATNAADFAAFKTAIGNL